MCAIVHILPDFVAVVAVKKRLVAATKRQQLFFLLTMG
jgi:hypothetical protein